MRVYDQIKDLMCDELSQIARQPLNAQSLETAYKAIDVIKDIHEIEEKEHGYSYGNFYEGNSMQGNINRYGMYPMYGYSFEQGRGQNAQRDSQGRYMDGSPSGNSMNGYAMNGGYYAGGSNTKEELKKLMEKATNETEKEAIRVAIESMNN
jgi:hypothetical protein